MGCDYRIAGRLAADMLCKLIGKGGRAGLITSDASSLPSATTFQMQQKITGFREVIAEQGNIEMALPLKLKHEEYDHPDRFGEYFRQVDGIYVTSAKLHVIARHLEEAGLGGTVALIGHDMTEDIYQDLDRGTVTATICQDPVNQGYLAVKTLFNLTASGEKVNLRENISKLELVTRENARYYI
ncbi:substrate-binding domain-containing protein [Paenibacillus sp. AR247]|uniref:substrate-binding domain-containing protein n=1 Tax=Paenibacillus sp. AR247 TaxID=1631599 RepID=UPI0021586EA9|nr:substrate-binding domain-containing protein [Paenibacillus sp. AR247]